ncbi:uncharacterized protein [Littorina saxatilis]|uniref:uncharacterized protein n=1 Tax=Littorina saxatilis TaxID=31220 RepID=UPI0038B5086B
MTDSVYLDLISRFGGPATTVPVPPVKVFPSSKHAHCKGGDYCIHTKGNGVAETARRLAPREIVINHEQVDILTKHKEGMVFLTGPPGTGKTLVLIIKGLDWLGGGKAVQVVSSAIEGKAAAHMIVTELKRLAATGTENNITTHHFDMTSRSEDSVVEALASEANQGELFIIADEISRDFAKLCIQLERRVQNLHVWAASLNHEDRPSEMKEEQLTEALRTPPIITREVMSSGFMTHQRQVLCYTSSNIPPPCVGPRSISIIHDKIKGHSGNTTYDCLECGKEVAVYLNELQILDK